MVRFIVISLAIFFVFVVVVAWISSGAPQLIAERKDSFENPIEALLSGEAFTLATTSTPGYGGPQWQPIDLYATFGTSTTISSYDGSNESRFAIERELAELNAEYDDLRARVNEARTFGDPSPYRDTVDLTGFGAGTTGDMGTQEADREYLTIQAQMQNTELVDLSNWSLQSVVTGKRVFIPQGTRTFVMGETPRTSAILLEPGASATIISGNSPLGVSFRENICSGYLAQFQSFYPPLEQQCPAPREEMPATLQNYDQYGVSCIEFIERLPRCEYYLGDAPSDISASCRSFIQTGLSYNGCVERHQWRPQFSNERWRVYLESPTELWRNGRDVIRLLDAQGRTVDVWTN